MSNHYAVVYLDNEYLDQISMSRPIDKEDYDDAWTFRIDCSDHEKCPAWQECMEDHSNFDVDNYYDGDIIIIHGEEHTLRYGWGWTVDYPGCAVIENAVLDEDLKLDKPRVYLLDADWDDTCCYLTVVKELK